MKWFDLSFSDVGTNCLSMFHIVNEYPTNSPVLWMIDSFFKANILPGFILLSHPVYELFIELC